MQEAYLRWPTTSELLSLLPGGEPTLFGTPPGGALVWDWSGDGFPLLRVDPDVEPGSRYVFSLADVLVDTAIDALDLDRHFQRWLKRLGWFARRLVLSLNLIPVAWTAPQPDEQPSEALAMTSPSPAAQPIPGGVRVVHKGTAAGQQIVMSHGVLMTGPPTVAHLQALADGCRTAFQSNVLQHLYSSFAYAECIVQDLSEAAAATAVANGTGTGGSVGDGAPLQAAGVIQWRTARAGRSFRGRTYMGPLPRGAFSADGRTLGAGNVTAYQSAWAAYRAAVDGLTGANGAAVAVLSTTRGLATPVTAVTVAQVLGTQRGRLR